MAGQTRDELGARPFAVSFAEKLVGSDGFKALFQEGMSLVEQTAAYLDGEGRLHSRDLPRMSSLAYASESMRLTTRLMQITSWLLLQRAVNEGELTRGEAEREHRKVKLEKADQPTHEDVLVMLPARLAELIHQSERLQARIVKLDQLLKGGGQDTAAETDDNPVAQQISMLKAALAQARD